MKLKKLLIIVISVFTLLTNCKNEQKENPALPVSTTEFMKIYTEILLLKYSKLPQTRKDSLMISVLQKNGFTRDKYDQCETYFKRNPEEWLKLIDKVDRNIRALTESDSLTDKKKIEQNTPK